MSVLERTRWWPGGRPIEPAEWAGYLLLAVPFAVMSATTGLGFRHIGDEGRFHLQAVERFSALGPAEAIVDYQAASTPLPYILWAGLGNLVGFEIWKLRLLSVTATFLAAVLLFRLARRYGLPYPLLSSLTFVFMPYIFFHGFTVYTTNIGLLFGIAALHFYFPDRVSTMGLFIGGLLATLAVYCRQYYLALPGGLLLYEMYAINWRASGFLKAARQNIWRLLLLALPAISLLPLVLLWHGLTPPQFYEHRLVRPVLQHLNFLPVFIGFYFFPQLFSSQTTDLFRTRRRVLLSLVVLVPLYLAFPLIYSDDPEAIGATTGIIAHGTHLVGQWLGGSTTMVALSILWTIGIVIILGELTNRQHDSFKMKMLAILAAFLFLITLTPFVSERYYTLAMPYLVLLFHRRFRHRTVLILWIGVQIALSMGFSYWQIAIKTFW